LVTWAVSSTEICSGARLVSNVGGVLRYKRQSSVAAVIRADRWRNEFTM
jgi:hypothetical protein